MTGFGLKIFKEFWYS